MTSVLIEAISILVKSSVIAKNSDRSNNLIFLLHSFRENFEHKTEDFNQGS